MKNKTESALPKMMSGSVHAQYVRCGRATCKCARGELHGAYYYLFVRVNGRLRKRYLKASQVESGQAACHAQRADSYSRREQSRQTWRKLREIRSKLREIKQFEISAREVQSNGKSKS